MLLRVSSQNKTIRNKAIGRLCKCFCSATVTIDCVIVIFLMYWALRGSYWLQSYFGHFTCTLKGLVTADEAISMNKNTSGDSRHCGECFISHPSPFFQQTQPESRKIKIVQYKGTDKGINQSKQCIFHNWHTTYCAIAGVIIYWTNKRTYSVWINENYWR